MAPSEDLDLRIRAIAALDQPLRRELYGLLAASDRWISRDEASEATGAPRSVAAFHLDKLAEAGLVEVMYERTSGRTGPGAGRPSKLYRRAPGEVAASVPERRYDLAGSLLAAAVADSQSSGRPIDVCLSTAARTSGRVIGEEAAAAAGRLSTAAQRKRAVLDVLARHGYEPLTTSRGEIAMANCPFHLLAEQHRSLVCGMNLEFLGGLLEGFGSDIGLDAWLSPEEGYCCVRMAAGRRRR